MAEKITAPGIRGMKQLGQRIVCLTAYDATLGALADQAGVDLILVGDTVGSTTLGYKTTVAVSLDEMLHHTRATRRGVKHALLVADLPFGSYQSSTEKAVDSAVALMKAGAEAVKLEGEYTEAIAAMVKAGIPVVGHVGLTPQSVNLFGGHKIQGLGEAGDAVLRSAVAIQEAGAFAIVLEVVPADLAVRITEALDIPTIGIGAGVGCSGQIQVIHDMLGLTPRKMHHSKVFFDGRSCIDAAIREYADEVRTGEFPGPEQSFENR